MNVLQTLIAQRDKLNAAIDVVSGLTKQQYTRTNETPATAAKIRARLTVHPHTRRATVSRNGAWTPARRKAHGRRMRAMWKRLRAAKGAAHE